MQLIGATMTALIVRRWIDGAGLLRRDCRTGGVDCRARSAARRKRQNRKNGDCSQ